MASGKSLLAKALADELAYEFIDIDKQVEVVSRKSISKIFEEDGELEFRKLEAQVLESLLQKENIVVAAGGGTPCFFHNINIINQFFISFFLNTRRELILQRLYKERSNRPILAQSNSIEKLVDELMGERLPYYQKANHIIDISNDETSPIIKLILRLI